MQNPNNKHIRCIVAIWLRAVAVLVFGVVASAQTRTNPDRTDRVRPARVTLAGTVDAVLRHTCSPGLLATQKENTRSFYCATTDLVLTPKDGFINVHLGPTKFIRDHHFFFMDGDRLLVIGFLLPSRGRSSVAPEEVIKAKRNLTLRDPNGRPLWGGNAQSELIPAPAISARPKQPEGSDRPSLASRPAAKNVATELRLSQSEKEK